MAFALSLPSAHGKYFQFEIFNLAVNIAAQIFTTFNLAAKIFAVGYSTWHTA
jgi:hypothetical protein